MDGYVGKGEGKGGARPLGKGFLKSIEPHPFSRGTCEAQREETPNLLGVVNCQLHVVNKRPLVLRHLYS
jgi:hypothetical protein